MTPVCKQSCRSLKAFVLGTLLLPTLLLSPSHANGQFLETGDGDGSAERPYVLTSFTDLYIVAVDTSFWSKHFILGNDIDASPSQFMELGKGWNPITMEICEEYLEFDSTFCMRSTRKSFTGSFDGKGYAITGLFINRPTDSRVGFFGSIDPPAVIRDVKFLDADVTGGQYTGILAGFVTGNTVEGPSIGSISGVRTSGEVNGTADVGGLIGMIQYGKVTGSSSEASVNASGYPAGGLIGYATRSVIKDSYATGDVTTTLSNSNGYIGGLIGSMVVTSLDTVTRTYATGLLTYAGGGARGGVLGNLGSYGTMGLASANFYDSLSTGVTTDALPATAASTAEMTRLATFTAAGWDFADETDNGTLDLWRIHSGVNGGYPFLETDGFSIPRAPVFIGASSDTLYVGDSVYVRIYTGQVTAEDEFDSYEFDITMPAGLTYVGYDTAGTLSNNGLFVANRKADTLSVAYAGSDNSTGDGLIIRLHFAPTDAGVYTLTPRNTYFKATAIDSVLSGSITAVQPPERGDVNGDGRIMAYDAALALQYSVGKDPLPNDDPFPWENWRVRVADVDQDGEVLAADAALILQYVVGLIDAFTVPRKAMNPEIIVQATDGSLHFSVAQTGLFGFNVSVPLREQMYRVGEPVVQAAQSLNAVHADGEHLRLGIASATAMSGTFLSLPIELMAEEMEGGDAPVLVLDIHANSERRQIEIPLRGLATSTNGDDAGSDGSDAATGLPTEFALEQNFPNPFNPATSITFAMPKAGHAVLEVFDLSGRVVARLVDGMQSVGVHTVQFDASSVSSGLYIYTLRTGEFTATRKMMLVK